MPSNRDIFKFFGIFLSSFLLLILCFNLKPVQNAHAHFFCGVETFFSNIVNPHVYSQLQPGAPPNPKGFDLTFNIWDKRKIKKKLNKHSSRKIKPTKIILQKHRELIIIPTLFLLALILATPINLKSKLIRLVISIALFYLFMTLYLGYRYELTFNNGFFEVNGLWNGLCWLGSLGGTLDNIYIVMVFIWGSLFLPQVFRKYRMAI